MGDSDNAWVRYVVYAVLACVGAAFLAFSLIVGVTLYFW